MKLHDSFIGKWKVILFGFNWVVKLLTFTSFMHLCTFVPLPSSKSSQEVLIWLSKERALASCHGARSTAITPNKGALPQETHSFSKSKNLDPHVPCHMTICQISDIPISYPIHPKKSPGSSVAPHDEAHPPPRGDRQGPVAALPQVHHTTALLVLVAVEVLTSEKKGSWDPAFPQLTSDHFSWSIIKNQQHEPSHPPVDML